MIAVITSTLVPSEKIIKSVQINPEYLIDRYSETLGTINSLLKYFNPSDLFLLDNSIVNRLENIESKFPFINTRHTYQYSFYNKGLSEIFLLLNNLDWFPDDVPILKISGRYVLLSDHIINLYKNSNSDVICKIDKYGYRKEFLSTRCYIIKNKKIFKKILEESLHIMYSTQYKVVGPRSFIKWITMPFKENNRVAFDPPSSIEWAFAQFLKTKGHGISIQNTVELKVSGKISGGGNHFFTE